MDLDTITKLINSPPAELLAGGVLAGIVWKFFERVENLLQEDTKLEIAIWLLGVKTTESVQDWPSTFANVFDRVFGKKHFSWHCFWRSAVASFAMGLLTGVILTRQQLRYSLTREVEFLFLMVFGFGLLASVIPDYVSLLQSRYVLKIMQ